MFSWLTEIIRNVLEHIHRIIEGVRLEGSQKIKECRGIVGSSPLQRGSDQAPVLSEVRPGLALGTIVTHPQNCVPQSVGLQRQRGTNTHTAGVFLRDGIK